MSSELERPLCAIRLIDEAGPPAEIASRTFLPVHNGTSLYFAVPNLGKQSVTLDLESAGGSRDARQRRDSSVAFL
ncbi:MAG TPA: hypothetical protein VEY94_01410 [Patescibacteria group bacterium]|nr:hypothetical protein [Patescibacteria group bacterium]